MTLLYCMIHLNVSAQGAVLARLQDEGTLQHRDGLLKALQLCERFINSNAASDEAYAVLKQEVAKAMLQSQQQVGQTPSLTQSSSLHMLCNVAAVVQMLGRQCTLFNPAALYCYGQCSQCSLC
jgi:hypothetical protein